MMVKSTPFLILLIICFTNSCTNSSSPEWYTYFPEIGTYSSPRMVDLNGDGILDVVMGAGGKEDQYSDSAIIAVDGTNGKLLWKVAGVNQFVGSAQFKDINGDDVPDVFIGGRWAQFAAVNGKDGSLLWAFYPDRTTAAATGSDWYNFTTPQFIPDQDGDGIEDLIVANGGNALAQPHDRNRPAGRVIVLSSKSGKLLANVVVPDGKETYMSVVCHDPNKTGNPFVYIGTGGETIGGHLFRTTLTDIMKGDISTAMILAESTTKGFIAAPTLVDLNNDGVEDVVINHVDGVMMAVNGATDSLLWKLEFPGTEAYTTPAVGDFNGDSLPDLFCNFAIGTFPKLERSVRFMVDGRSGEINYRDTILSFQYASAVSADITGDGIDDVLVNQSELQRLPFQDKYYSYLQVFDFRNNKIFNIGDTMPATNFASTPWIGDIDGDDKMDIIYSAVKFDDVRFDLQKPQGLLLGHFPTNIPIKKSIAWGSYMGSRYTGIYPANKALINDRR